MEEKKNSNSNSPALRREKNDLTGASVKWVGDKPSASKNPFRYSYLVHGLLYYWTAMSSYFLLTSGQHEAGTWDPNYTPGLDFLDHNFL